jgi:PAS domain S-box-containing protein
LGIHYLESEINALISRDGAVFHLLDDGSLDGIWFWNLDAPADLWMSPRFWRALGYDPASMPHRADALFALLDPEDRALFDRNLAAHLADPDAPFDQLVRYRHADGSTVWIRCRGVALRDATGRPTRMLGAHSDVTTQKEQEMVAERRADALKTVNEELREFAYALSHDMKGPVNTASQALAIVAAEAQPPLHGEAREMLEAAMASIARLDDLLGDVLRYTRIIGSVEPPAPFDLCETMREAVEAECEAAQIADAEITVRGPPQTLTGYRWQVAMALRNLIGNALKYRDPDRPLRVSLEASPLERDRRGGAVVTVRDTGLGIDARYAQRVFGLFERLHGHGEIPGSGLGLPICRRVAMKHGGWLALESEPGVGSTFTLTLPNATEPPA